MFDARNDSWMKALLFALAFGTTAQIALAAEPDCRAIESTGARLICYDAAYPPKAKKPAALESDGSRVPYKDPLVAEDARIAAKLKNICRGC